jgi:3-oxoacyl-[acyl-carrier protein] reductase
VWPGPIDGPVGRSPSGVAGCEPGWLPFARARLRTAWNALVAQSAERIHGKDEVRSSILRQGSAHIGNRVDLQLDGRTAVVSGASAGIGRTIARLLADEGVRVLAIARREAELEGLRLEVAAGSPGEVIPFAADITATGTPQQAVAEVRARLGTVDILVNNAGDSRPVGLGGSDDVWAESMLLNFEAARRMTEALVPMMVEQRSGRVINITATNEPSDTLNAGTPPKAALHMWAKALSRVVGPDRITVNSVAPGRIMSEQMVTRLYPTEASRDEFARGHIPLGRFGTTEELANLVLFLASPLAGYITGQVIHVDGGMSRYAY